MHSDTPTIAVDDGARATPHETALRAAYAAWDALGDEIPSIERLQGSLDAYRAVLEASGLLIPPHVEPTPVELDDVARFLGRHSRFPRYWVEGEMDGGGAWQILRQSVVDVEVAFRKAMALLGAGEGELAAELRYARDLLTAHVEADGDAA